MKRRLLALAIALLTLGGVISADQAVISRYAGTIAGTFGTLVVSGAATLGSLAVSGLSALTTLTVSSTSVFTGTGTFNGTLDANGTTTLDGTTTASTPILLSSGTAAAPSAAWSADADGSGTGLFRSAADTFGFSTNGVNQWTLSATALAPVATLSETVGTATLQPSVVYAGSLQGNFVKTLAESSGTPYVTLTVPNSTDCSGTVAYTIFAADATNTQAKAGLVFFSAVANSSGAVTAATATDTNPLNPVTSGTLTNTMAQNAGVANAFSMSANAASSLTQTTLEIRYRIQVSGACTVIPL